MYNCSNARLFSDLMKITVVIESLSLYQSNVLFKRKTLPNHECWLYLVHSLSHKSAVIKIDPTQEAAFSTNGEISKDAVPLYCFSAMFCAIMETVEPWYVSKELSPTIRVSLYKLQN